MANITQKIDMIDLFAGTGGFSQAFEDTSSDFQSVFSNDMIPSSKAIYDLNHSACSLTLEDLIKIPIKNIPSHNILTGGFPCQPFSIAGQKKGFKDPRSNVFWKIIEILHKHKPEVIVLENVKNLKTHDKGKTFKTIKSKLEDEGYHLKYEVLDTCKITDIPHHRERIYIVGFLDEDLCDDFDFDFPTVKNKPITDFLEKKIDKKYYYTDRFKVYDVVKKGVTKHIKTNTLYQYRRTYVRENKSGKCPTLTKNNGGGGHNVPLLLDNNGIRKLTPRECFNLQGFPKTYKFPPKMSDSALYKLAGNAISPPVVKLIADKIYKLIK